VFRVVVPEKAALVLGLRNSRGLTQKE